MAWAWRIRAFMSFISIHLSRVIPADAERRAGTQGRYTIPLGPG
jgi:hypothetical protein